MNRIEKKEETRSKKQEKRKQNITSALALKNKPMKTLPIPYSWINDLIPDGLPYHTSTILSGPGGTGKPLAEFAFVAAWLKAGGSVIGIPLQYSSIEFVRDSLLKLYQVDINDYPNQFVYIKFNPLIDNCKQVSDNTIEANLAIPKVWDESVIKAERMLKKTELETMVFGSALNLLLFSPTYKEATLANITSILNNDRTKTYVFSVSTSAYAEEIALWEDAADNLMLMRVEKPMKLYFNIERMLNVSYKTDEIIPPFTGEIILEIKKTANATRKKMLPEIKKI